MGRLIHLELGVYSLFQKPIVDFYIQSQSNRPFNQVSLFHCYTKLVELKWLMIPEIMRAIFLPSSCYKFIESLERRHFWGLLNAVGLIKINIVTIKNRCNMISDQWSESSLPSNTILFLKKSSYFLKKSRLHISIIHSVTYFMSIAWILKRLQIWSF